jgi:hypothetical protein
LIRAVASREEVFTAAYPEGTRLRIIGFKLVRDAITGSRAEQAGRGLPQQRPAPPSFVSR